MKIIAFIILGLSLLGIGYFQGRRDAGNENLPNTVKVWMNSDHIRINKFQANDGEEVFLKDLTTGQRLSIPVGHGTAVYVYASPRSRSVRETSASNQK